MKRLSKAAIERQTWRLQFFSRERSEKFRKAKLLAWSRYRHELLTNGRSCEAQQLFHDALTASDLQHNVHWAMETPR